MKCLVCSKNLKKKYRVLNYEGAKLNLCIKCCKEIHMNLLKKFEIKGVVE